MGLPAAVYADEAVRYYGGDCLQLMPHLPSASIHLIIADVPYFKKKLDYLGRKLTWDRQWKTRTDYLAWLKCLALEWQRLLTPNGSLYCFADPGMAAHVEVMLEEVFTVIQRMTWRKPPFATKAEMVVKEDLHSFFPVTEAILFCEQRHADAMALGESGYAAQCETLHGHVFEPIRAYLDGERQRAGIDKAACNKACGFAPTAGAMASRHYFSRSQWARPTQEHYSALQQLFNTHGRHPAPAFTDYHPAGSPFARFHRIPDEYLRADYEALRADYEYLRADYEALRADYEALRRPFHVTKDVPYTDCWDFPTVPYQPGKHAAEKPMALLQHMITVSSRPGDLIFDPCAGSGSTLDAARACGRRAIGFELEASSCQVAYERLRQQRLW